MRLVDSRLLKTTFGVSLAIIASFGARVAAQDLEPRAYSRAPVGTKFVVLSYAHQSGDVLLDSALPLKDVSVKLNSVLFGYGQTFGLAGRQANLSFVAPYILGHAKGTVFETQQEVRRSGIGDVRVRLGLNILGSPALTPKEFAARKPKTVLGTSVTVTIPTGQYDPNRLVNLGSNRWAIRAEAGLSHPAGRWTIEGISGVSWFTENKNFFGGSVRAQKPLISLQGHLIYTLRPRMWLALNGTYYTGGRTSINGVASDDRQKNTRIGATYSFPINKNQSIKIVGAKGVTTRIGGDLSTVAVTWQYMWF